jgi:hypothetical protein
LPLESFNKRSASKDGLQPRCRECQYKLTLAWKRANKDRNYELDRKWVSKNRETTRKLSREYYARHREKELYRSAEKRVKRKLSRSSCLTSEQEQQIKDFYWLAKDLAAVTGESYHVDHIVPLQGKSVCGLHVPWNLQVLPADINLSKGNKHGNLA